MGRGGVKAGGSVRPLAVALANSKRQSLSAETGVTGPTRTAAIDSAQVRSQLAAMSVLGLQILQSDAPDAIGMAAIVVAAFAPGTAVEIVSVPAKKMAISKITRLRAKLVIKKKIIEQGRPSQSLKHATLHLFVRQVFNKPAAVGGDTRIKTAVAGSIRLAVPCTGTSSIRLEESNQPASTTRAL